MVSWTKEQEEAIYTDGSDILVAAAAGSGKTAVLVERIIQKLLNKENPVDIDSLLVVTFTNAAAQEMRNRVGLTLEKALAENPASNHLKKQLSLLQRASISTLHSFCMDVVKQYAYLLDLDPSFRIANDMEADLMKQDVMDDLFEEWYGKEGEEQERFFAVVDRFSSDRSDVDVEEVIRKLYAFAINHPWPDLWLDELAQTYDVPEDCQEQELVWLEILKREVRMQLKAIEEEISLALKIAESSDGPVQYVEAIESDLANVQQAYKYIGSWDDLQVFMASSTFVSLSRKKTECDSGKKEKVKKLRDGYKDRWKKMKEKWFMRNLQGHISDMRELAPVIKQLTALVKQFKEKFTKQKREKAIVDFSDLEHFCLQLFLDASSTAGNPIPSSVARHFQEQFSELLVDEYQDVNRVQETILMLLSDQSGSGNMFMVGDVKQSIYRFRHAEPTLFIEKYNRFAKEEHAGKRIDLARNFRSREDVLTGANYIFRQILDEELGDIQYDADAELIYANKMYDVLENSETTPEFLIIDQEADEASKNTLEEEDYRDLEKAQLEARAYAEKIKAWIGQKESAPLQIVDKATGKQRDIQYRDIVILQRSMGQAPTMVEELKNQGIPVYAELSTGYFDAIEIKILISLLKVIDNPRQDIPLASVLRSPIVGLNEEELASIRLAGQRKPFYDALKQFKNQNNNETSTKAANFLEQLRQFRIASRQGALSELIWQIYRETGIYDFVGGMPGGRQRQANLRALYDRARSYETTSFRGLFRFLRFIERMEENGEDLGAARALSEQEDVVRMMTIHSSKGLEFPVVILGGMDKQFNMQDLNQKYLLHKDLGFASKYIDPIKRITYPTLFYYALREEKSRELLAEEMRVLYVALTRAKEKLVMIGNVSSFEKKRDKWEKMLEYSQWVLPVHFRAEAKSYLDWVGPALIRHNDNDVLRAEQGSNDEISSEIRLDPSNWKVTIVHGSALANLTEKKEEADKQLEEHIINWKPITMDNREMEQWVDERLSYTYPFQESAESRAKQTVTEIKRQRELKDEYSADQIVKPFQPSIVKRPNFMQKEKIITAAERGTAMHTVMQHLPMTKSLNEEEIEEYTEVLVEREILTKQEAEIIDIRAIREFFMTDIAACMMNVSTIYREVPFSITLPASEIYASWKSDVDEQVLIQGVIDCLIPKEDGWMLLDYKTDVIDGKVTEQMINKLRAKYEVQMNLYRHAIEQIWRQPVKETYLYFFSKQLMVNVPTK
ncbi:MAG TPA: helicase-exonuclease AddAB subunit AddA [Virgibacillus sp.]|nr:helicase-exonuclease AddAB subunit AddA [Virgibacillus sp.]HLR65791.1 helicase-exonuclease AddAB subunit AddA [Virgibacillus sp.]